MIGYLSGTVVYSEPNKSIIVTTQGVGFEVYTSSVLVPNKDVALYIAHIIREQSQDLYGFETIEDKKFFEMLLDVNGIGPKSAFSLISHLGSKQIVSAVTLENVDILKSAPGVGKKSAEQLILSLKDKVLKLEIGFSVKEKPMKPSNIAQINSLNTELIKDTLAAFQGLGYKDQEVMPLLQRHLQNTESITSEGLIKLVLMDLR